LGWKIAALFEAKKILGDDYKTYLDLMAGVGFSGKIFGTDNMVLNDSNRDCYEILKDNFSCTIRRDDASSFEFAVKYDFIFLDFNKYTICHYDDWWKSISGAFNNSNKYVMITDSSPFGIKFPSNRKGYTNALRTDVNSFVDYVNGARTFYEAKYPKYKLLHVFYYHNCSLFLFERTKKKWKNAQLHKIGKKVDIELINKGKELGEYL
jgi:hypothetical protein